MDALARDIGDSDSVRSIGRIRRFWWLVLLGALLGLVVGSAAVALIQKQYTSTTTVFVYPPTDQTQVAGARTNSNVNMDNELQFLTSVDVVTAAKDLLKVDTDADVLERNLTATVPANTSVIDVSYAASSPTKAQQYSHAFATAYLQVRTDQGTKAIAAQNEKLTKQLTALQALVARYSGEATATAASSPAHQNALVQLDILKNSVSNVQQRLQQLQQVDPTAGAIIQDATAPTAPSKPIPGLYVGTGIFVGLMLGLALAVLAARLDKRVRRPEDVEQRAARPVIASIPKPAHGKAPGGVLSARTGSGEFDRLRLRLDSATPDRASSVVITSPDRGYGRSFVVGNLGLSMARSGAEVVVISADPDSTVGTMFGLADTPGLSAALLEDRPLDQLAQPVVGRPRLRVVVPGRDLADVFDRVPVQRVAAMVDRLVQDGNHVIIEAPEVRQGTDAQELARWAGSALVVVELGSTRLPAVQYAFDELEHSGALVLGAVVIPNVPAPTRAATPDVAERAAAETVTPARP
jgi:polysaccharide biosynthesis transport protein